MSKIEPQAAWHKTKCPFCGDSPVNHFASYFEGTMDVVFETTMSLPGINFLSRKLFRIINPHLGRTIFGFLHFLGIAKLTPDIETTPSLRARVIWLEARRRGIEMDHFLVFGRKTDFYRAKINDRFIYFRSLPVPHYLEPDDVSWIDDKYLLKRKLRREGIPVPRSYSVSSRSEALRAFRRISPASIVVKPRTGSRGRHTSVFIQNKGDLVKAFRIAQRINYYVQIEEQLFGSVCRATVVNGKLRGFLKANPPRILGDGVRTVGELIEEKNKNRPDSIGEVIIKPEIVQHIARQGFGLEEVLPKGKVLPLVFRTGRLFGGDTEEMCSEIHPTLREEIERAAEALNIKVVGFDLIIEDPTLDPNKQKWGIIEGNTVPFIDLHDFAYVGAPANVAKHIWDLWE